MNSRAEMQVRTEGTKVVVSVKTPPAPRKATERKVVVTTSDVYQELLARGFDVNPQHIEGGTLDSEISQRGTWVYSLKEKPKVPSKTTTTIPSSDAPTPPRRKRRSRPKSGDATTTREG